MLGDSPPPADPATGARRPARSVAALWALILGAALAGPAAGQQTPTPALVAVTLDTSGSVQPAILDRTVALALGVLEALPPGSQVAVFSFDDVSRLMLERTSDRDAVRRALAGAERAGRFTALHDALYDASRYLAQAPHGRKAILLLTDGHDENSALVLEDGLAVAVENGIPVFAVGVGRAREQELRRIAKLTGGDYAPLAEASGERIAGRILALDVVAAPRPTPAPSATPAIAESPGVPPDTGRSARWLAALLFAALLAAVAAGLYVLRRRGYAPGAPSAVVADDEPATMVVRSEEAGDTPRTVLLGSRPALEIVAGPGRGRVFRLAGPSALSIGRSSSCEIVLDDESVSGQHCRVRPQGGGWVLVDLKSTNGSFVNERKVSRHTLEPGDVVRIGETSLRYRIR